MPPLLLQAAVPPASLPSRPCKGPATAWINRPSACLCRACRRAPAGPLPPGAKSFTCCLFTALCGEWRRGGRVGCVGQTPERPRTKRGAQQAVVAAPAGMLEPRDLGSAWHAPADWLGPVISMLCRQKRNEYGPEYAPHNGGRLPGDRLPDFIKAFRASPFTRRGRRPWQLKVPCTPALQAGSLPCFGNVDVMRVWRPLWMGGAFVDGVQQGGARAGRWSRHLMRQLGQRRCTPGWAPVHALATLTVQAPEHVLARTVGAGAGNV